jgi:hypothetical protein
VERGNVTIPPPDGELTMSNGRKLVIVVAVSG